MDSVHRTLRAALVEAHARWLDTGECVEITGLDETGNLVIVQPDQQQRLWSRLGLPLKRETH